MKIILSSDGSWTFRKSDIGERGFLLTVDIFIGIIIGEFFIFYYFFFFQYSHRMSIFNFR